MKDHLHIYERIRGKGGANVRYRCLDPTCTHIQLSDLLEGKRVRCSICKNNELVVNGEDLRRKHFRCIECSNTKRALELREKQAKAASLMNTLFDFGGMNGEGL